MKALVILGNQLFAPALIRGSVTGPFRVFMREDAELCTYYRFHKHKIIFFLAAMRSYADELRGAGIDVHYEKLASEAASYEERLTAWLKKEKISKVSVYEIEDKFFEQRILRVLEQVGVEIEVLRSPMFLTPREIFAGYLSRTRQPFMKTFYEGQRKRLKILVNERLEPVGGAWSFDQENRLALPPELRPPTPLGRNTVSPHVTEVARLCQEFFPTHPGSIENFWLPVDREGARQWLDTFLAERLAQFGPYEDAIPAGSDFVFHSVLTPFLNTGLLTPAEVLRATLAFARRYAIPLNSLEGFVRQIIGWREFVRGVYRHFSERQESTNFFHHRATLTDCWYEGNTGIPPLDQTIKKVLRYGYAHHIERLMVVGNLMLLLEVAPHDAHRWFMEMFVDSSDWVMGPNVYGMALFSDGGIFATKPYICGSNYFRKMGGYKKSDWCDGVDGLYWSFVEKHKGYFLKNPRLSMIARSVEKMEKAKRERLFAAADELRKKLVVLAAGNGV